MQSFKNGDIITFPSKPVIKEQTTKYPQGISIVRMHVEVNLNGKQKFLPIAVAEVSVSLLGITKTVRAVYGDERFRIDFGSHIVELLLRDYKLVEYRVLKNITLPDTRLILAQQLAGKKMRCIIEEVKEGPFPGKRYRFEEI